MNHRRAVVLAACLASAATLLAPRPAAACDDDRRPAPASLGALPLPPPWVAVVLPPPPPGPWGGPSLSVHYRWLDANRAAYLARFGWNPWRVARYDAWYRDYRAALDLRAAPPLRVAWEHGRGHGRGHDRRDHRDR